LTIVLASSSGATGAALATLCGESVLALGLLAALRHGHPELAPRPGIILKVALAAAPAVALGLLPRTPSLLRMVLALGAYGLMVLLTKAVPREMLELLPSRLRRTG